MKEIFHRISVFLNINGRDLPVFLLSLLLAFSIWLIHTLSYKYTDYISVRVQAVADIRGHAAMSSNNCEVIARCRTTGYNIVSASMKKKRPVKVNFQRLHSLGGENFYITASELQDYTHHIFGENVSLEYYVSDTLFFRFPYEANRVVPVFPVHKLDLAPQYAVIDKMKVEPDSVLIYGEPRIIDDIEYAFTEPVRFSGLKSSLRGVVNLEKIHGVRYEQPAVRYSLDVARYVEMNLRLPVNIKNAPDDKQVMVYPSTVDVVFRCAYPNVRNLSEEVSVYVNYEDIVSSKSGKCMLQADVPASNVISYRIVPQIVECLLND